MPTHHQTISITITPERFVNLCNETELNELLILASAKLTRLENERKFNERFRYNEDESAYDKTDGIAGMIRDMLMKEQETEIVNVRYCRVCGCTDTDCSNCIAETGEPCHWVEKDLCSACVPKIENKP